MNFVRRLAYFDVSYNLQTNKQTNRQTDTKITIGPYCSGSVEKSRTHTHKNNQPRPFIFSYPLY